jgi:hypothetical protein
MYLIIRCDELGDQWECDADRTPIAIVDDWQKWFEEHKPLDYLFEVYVWDGKEMTIIKDLYAPMDEGMVLCFWEDGNIDNAHPVILQQWSGKTRKDDIPPCVWEEISTFLASKNNVDGDTYKDVRNSIRGTGEYSWRTKTDNGLFIYGEYFDNRYPSI